MRRLDLRRELWDEHGHVLSCCPKSHDPDCFGWVEFEEKAAVMPLAEMIEEHRDAIDCCDNFSSPEWREHFPAYAKAESVEEERP